MDKYSYLSNSNPQFIEDLYQQYQNDPSSVDEKWKSFFDGFDFYESTSAESGTLDSSASSKEIAVSKLINTYRSRGHLISKTNPVRERRLHKTDLELNYFGLSEKDNQSVFEAGKEIGLKNAKLNDILNHLTETYCSSIGVEFMYCQDEKLRNWLVKEMEPIANKPKYSKEKQRDPIFEFNMFFINSVSFFPPAI